MQGRQPHRPAADADGHGKQFSAHAVAGRRTEHHRQDKIGRSRGDEQDLCVHIRVKNTVADRYPAACQQPQCQYAARHGTGHGKQQQDQPQQLLLPAEGHQCQQHTYRQLGGKGTQKVQSRQEYRYRIDRAQQRSQDIPPSLQGNPCQTGCHKEQHIVHGPVQEKHTVRVYYCHSVPLLPLH